MKKCSFNAVALAAFAAMCAARAAAYDSIRIMSFNICHCATHYSLGITDEDVRRTASVIAAENPDFVCLQEVDDKTTRSSGIDETARLAELTGMTGTFGKARNYQGGGYGVAILSRQAPLSVATRTVEGNEARLLLICEFDDCYIATIHMDNNRDLRLASIATVRDALADLDKPVFISGDWNATPDSETLDAMRAFVTIVSPESGVRTFGGFEGDDYVIDYIAVDTADADKYYVQRGYCVSNMVDGQGSSDHNPVIADVVKVPESFGWVEENAVTTGRTGTWNKSVEYAVGTMKADLVGDNAFTPMVISGGNRVTMTVTATFDNVPYELDSPPEGAQASIWLGTNGCFQIWSSGGWVDVEAEGITPTTGVDYTFRFTFDYAAKAYSVAVQYGEEWKPLVGRVISNAPSFPLATSASAVSGVRFTGDGVFTSLLGEYENVKVSGFRLILR